MARLLGSLLLGGALFAVIAWQMDLVPWGHDDVSSPGHGTGPERKTALDLGDFLYPPEKVLPPQKAPAVRGADPIVALGRVNVIDMLDVSPQVTGQLLFIGEEVPEGAAQVAGLAAFIAEPFESAKINQGERDVIKLYRRLYESQVVNDDQMVALMDPSKALGDLAMKRTKVLAAHAEYNAAKAGAQEAEIRYRTALDLYAKKVIAREELGTAELTRDKMLSDAVSKFEAAKLARGEEHLSQINYRLHEVRNKIPVKRCFIKAIYKNRGDGVKELEPIMHLHSLDRLLAEAMVEAQYQYQGRIKDGMLVTIEPSQEQPPLRVFHGHVGAVTCVAVTRAEKEPLIVSASEDKSVCVWSRHRLSPLREFKHPEPVKAMACSPGGAQHNLIIAGCADGSIRLWDLDAKVVGQDSNPAVDQDANPDRFFAQEKPFAIPPKMHNESVTALAFSPDGSYFASGAADGSINLWETAGAKHLYSFTPEHGVDQAHQGSITSLHFTPQCRLVSAGRDNSLRVWALKQKGATLEYDPLAGRGGNVGSLGVSDDGRFMIFDQGKSLQMRWVMNGRIANTVQNPGGAIPFDTLALLSADASLLLTAGAAEGRLQLWQAPTETSRGFEIRQLATDQRTPVTCAAFGPPVGRRTTLAVSGNKDGQVYLWAMPTKEEVDNHPIRNVPVRLVAATLDPATRQIRIGVEVPNLATAQNPLGRLSPGRPVTIVIE